MPEESRCQFVGHEHDTVKSMLYSNLHNLQYLFDNVASKLDYPVLDFNAMKHCQVQFAEILSNLCAKKAKQEAHKLAMKARSKN